MSNRAREYRELIEDVVNGGLLAEDEWMQLKDVVARVVRKLEEANKPAKKASQGQT